MLENGNVSNLIFYFDNAFSAEFKTQVWGFDTDVVLYLAESDYGWNNSAVVGFKYLDVRENLIQRGIFDNVGTIPPITSVIDSATQNSVYGPSFGFRTEYRFGIFSIGAEPKLMFGVNSYDASVETFDLRQLNDINIRNETSANQFAAVFDLALQAKVKVREGCVLTVGYDFMWVHGVTRPDDNIYYNDNGGFPVPPGIELRTKSRTSASMAGRLVENSAGNLRPPTAISLRLKQKKDTENSQRPFFFCPLSANRPIS